MSDKSIKGERFPRQQIAEYLQDWLLPACLKYSRNCFVGGSYIRETPDCGDIDIALCEPDPVLLAELSLRGTPLINGDKVRRYKLPLHKTFVQVDIWIAPPYNWGAVCMFVAGNGRLNIRQRFAARQQGFNLGFSVTRLSDKEHIPLFSEQEVYDYFHWKWIPYRERSV